MLSGNIVIVSNTYWPEKNGVQMVNQYMAEGLVKRGRHVLVLTLNRDRISDIEEHNGVQIRRFNIRYTKTRKYAGEIQKFQECLLELDRSGQMEVMVTVCANSFAGQCCFGIIDQLKCKKVMYNHGMRDGKLHIDKITSVKSLVKEIICGRLDAAFYKKNWKSVLSYDAAIHLFYNDSSYSYFVRRGFKNNYIIMNTCEEIMFERDADSPAQGPGKTPYFIYVANFCSRKDQLRAVEAFYKADISNVELVLVGSEKNNYYKAVKKKVCEWEKRLPKHSKVRLITGIERCATIAMIKNAYAVLMTSMNEYFPITIAEGMAAGKPFISTNVGIVSMLPGGQVSGTTENLSYWLEYYSNNKEFVGRLGDIAHNYAADHLRLEDKIAEFEKICEAVSS